MTRVDEGYIFSEGGVASAFESLRMGPSTGSIIDGHRLSGRSRTFPVPECLERQSQRETGSSLYRSGGAPPV